ncbi:hypothetical protein ACWEOH_17500 [Agromyces sp. NPDC004153]
MNTGTASLRRVVAASVIAVATCLAGCAAPPSSAGSRAHLLPPHVDAVMQRMLVHEAADRYVIEQLVRARLPDEPVASRGLIITRVHGR